MDKPNLTALQNFIEIHNEFILVHETGKTFALKSSEIELETGHNRVLFSFLDESGFQTWRILDVTFDDSKVCLNLTRNFQTEKTSIELIPRIKAEELIAKVELARLDRANKIGQLIGGKLENTKLLRVELNKENGRFAQIIVERTGGNQIAVVADVTEKIAPEEVLSFALIWLSRLQRRKKNPIDKIWIASRKGRGKNLRKIHACLSESSKKGIELFEITGKPDGTKIASLKPLATSDLWKYKPGKLHLTKKRSLSAISREIVKLAPEKIDFLYSKNGETLRYLGLPFLRVRKISGEEKAWFGIDQKRRVLDKDSYEDFYELLEDLKTYRSSDTPNRYHALYETAPEAWLESILRQNIKLLDQNLILSPIYNQFRTSRDKIDLLALRKDGRLIIIELKVSSDREMIFQAVDYWRKIELQRQKGLLDQARLFGQLEIADQPTIIYLVAPALSYHPDFEFLSKSISKDIEIFRFDLVINWREKLKTLNRKRL